MPSLTDKDIKRLRRSSSFKAPQRSGVRRDGLQVHIGLP